MNFYAKNIFELLRDFAGLGSSYAFNYGQALGGIFNNFEGLLLKNLDQLGGGCGANALNCARREVF